MAGAEGLEPSTKVLETHVLPLHHAPSLFSERVLLYPCTPEMSIPFSKKVCTFSKEFFRGFPRRFAALPPLPLANAALIFFLDTFARDIVPSVWYDISIQNICTYTR